MSGNPSPPAGWSAAQFEAIAHDVGSWLWGTVQGTFNEKATFSQILVDAVVGMIPLVGDATAARDLMALSVQMIDEPKKRTDKWQILLLVVLLFALIPVVGGAIKGVGRILVKAGIEASHLAPLARAAHMEQVAKDVVAFLNRIGHGHAEKWLLGFNPMQYQAAILAKYDALLYTLIGTLVSIERKLGSVLSPGMRQRISGLENGVNWLRKVGAQIVPQGLKDFYELLKEIQQFIRSGGETTSRITAHTVVAGDRAVVTMTDELRLLEGAGGVRSARGGWIKNPGRIKEFEAKGLYKFEPGYPNLTKRFTGSGEEAIYIHITTYSGKIVNRELDAGEKVFRVFGPVQKGGVHGYTQMNAAMAAGDPKHAAKFWGLGAEPKNAEEWRRIDGGVLDEWNHDGYILTGTVEKSGFVKACTGKIAEQIGDNIPGQYLPGGGKQAMLETPAPLAEELNALAAKVMADGKPRSLSAGGFSWAIKPTGWADVNGLHGYGLATGKAAIQTVRLGAREQSSKVARDEQGAH